mgnify:CR=1 FL=1
MKKYAENMKVHCLIIANPFHHYCIVFFFPNIMISGILSRSEGCSSPRIVFKMHTIKGKNFRELLKILSLRKWEF